MSGLIGGYFFNPNANRFIGKMGTACPKMAVGNIDNESSYKDEPGMLSLYTVSSNGVHSCGIFESETCYTLFLGSLYCEDGKREDHIPSDSYTLACSSAKIATDLYHRFGASLVDHLNGIFICIVWDKTQKKLLLFSDRYGFEHLYYYQSDDAFLFSTDVFALIKVLDEQPVIDTESLADLFNYNMIFDDRSVYKEITLCDPAMHYEICNNKVTLGKYWEYPRPTPLVGQESHFFDKSKSLIASAIGKVTNGYGNVGSLLSGGLDSRLLTAVLNEQGIIKRAFSYKHVDAKSNDHVIAQTIAKNLELIFELIVQKTDGDIETGIRDSLLLTDGQIGFSDLNDIIAIAKLCPGIALVNGFLMDTLFKSGWMYFQKRDDCLRMSQKQLLSRYSIIGDYVFDRFLSQDFASLLKDRKRKRIKDEFQLLDPEKPESASFNFYCRNRGKRFHSVVSKSYRNYVDILMPGTEYELFDFASRLPHDLRSSSRFYREIISDWFPGVAAIPWDKTGRPLVDGDGSKGSAKVDNYLEKAKYYLQRITQGRADLKNPPSSFNYRFRHDRGFRDTILAILSDKTSLERGVYDRAGLDRLVKEQLQGRDYAPLFYLLLRTEILYRISADV